MGVIEIYVTWEFEVGAEIDERTNVFNMGAIAFGLLGGELDRSILKWDAGSELYEIAMKAVQKNKGQIFNSRRILFWMGIMPIEQIIIVTALSTDEVETLKKELDI